MALQVETIRLDQLTSDPVSPADGEVWYNSTTNKFNVQLSGSTVLPLLINPMTGLGDMIYGETGGIPTRLTGSVGGYLRSNANVAAPEFTRDLDVSTLFISSSTGGSIDSSAVFQIDSTDKGFILARMTFDQRNAIVSPATGLTIYDTTNNRIEYYDGSIWRRLTVRPSRYIAVSATGADFTSIQAAIDSVADASDANRYVVEVFAGIYSETITLKDYVTVRGQGWDTLVYGQLIASGSNYVTAQDFRIVSTNQPSLVCNVVGECDLVGIDMEANYDSSVGPSVTRSVIDLHGGTLFVYKESETYLSVTDVVNTASSTRQCIYNITGSNAFWLESYGTYHQLDTDNTGNDFAVLKLNSSAPFGSNWAFCQAGYSELTFSNTGHTNKVSIVLCENSDPDIDYIDSQVNIYTTDTTLSLVSAVVSGTLTAGDVTITDINYDVDADISANSYVGASCTSLDHLNIMNVFYETPGDTPIVRYTALGSLGEMHYVVYNGAGSSFSNGEVNGLRVYGHLSVDPADPPPSDGDTYYNTAIREMMNYDGSRSKWLSVSSYPVSAGRNGNTAPGSFYRGPDGLTFAPGIGFTVPKGTLTTVSWSKTSVASGSLETIVSGSVVHTLTSSVADTVFDYAANADFNAGLMQFRNKSTGNTTSNVVINAVYKKRA